LTIKQGVAYKKEYFLLDSSAVAESYFEKSESENNVELAF
jgi:hypothetical protein